MQTSGTRPKGIGTLVVLEAVASALFVLSGLVLAALYPYIVLVQPVPGPEGRAMAYPMLGIALLILGSFWAIIAAGVMMLIVGLLGLVAARGLWAGRERAWTLASKLAVAGVVLGAVFFAAAYMSTFLAMVLYAFIAVYLRIPVVKAFYGKQAAVQPYQKSVALAVLLALIPALCPMLWGVELWGLGHVYMGRMARGVALLLSSLVFILRPLLLILAGYGEPSGEMVIILTVYVPFVVGIAIGILQGYDAYRLANRYNEYAREHARPP